MDEPRIEAVSDASSEVRGLETRQLNRDAMIQYPSYYQIGNAVGHNPFSVSVLIRRELFEVWEELFESSLD